MIKRSDIHNLERKIELPIGGSKTFFACYAPKFYTKILPSSFLATKIDFQLTFEWINLDTKVLWYYFYIKEPIEKYLKLF